jgi:hypothetical protein
MPTNVTEQAPVPPPAYHRAQARLGPALHIDALTEVARYSHWTWWINRSAITKPISGCFSSVGSPVIPSVVSDANMEAFAPIVSRLADCVG